MSKDKEFWHNKGQEDASTSESTLLGETNHRATILDCPDSAEEKEAYAAYEEGFNHTKSQSNSHVICTHFYKKGIK